MSEKPFWKGKTCKELDGLHVKITWNNGDTMTSTLNIFGNAGQCELSPARHPAATFAPYADIKSIELVDDPEYERIDNIEDVREGDVYVGTDGNRYTVLQRTTSNLQPLTGSSHQHDLLPTPFLLRLRFASNPEAPRP